MITLKGIYQGKNLYVQNPFAPNGVGFCVYEVRVNGSVTTDETQSSAFEIDLRNFNFKVGDAVEVQIYHKDDCKVKILNPEVLMPKSTFEVTAMEIVPSGSNYMLNWTTRNERGILPFMIEQYRWNKWVKVGEVDGTGLIGPNKYTFQVLLHSGENTFRVKQVDYSGTPRISQITAKFRSPAAAISFSPARASTEIVFSAATSYEVYDQYGNIVKKGTGIKLDVTALQKGGYFLNYDNASGEFIKL